MEVTHTVERKQTNVVHTIKLENSAKIEAIRTIKLQVQRKP